VSSWLNAGDLQAVERMSPHEKLIRAFQFGGMRSERMPGRASILKGEESRKFGSVARD